MHLPRLRRFPQAKAFLKLGCAMLACSQLLALAVYAGLNREQLLFRFAGERVSAQLVEIHATSRGYLAVVEYKGRRATTELRDPPALRDGQLTLHVSREHPGQARVLEDRRGLPLAFFQLASAFFALFFFSFIALAAFATDAFLQEPSVAERVARLRDELEKQDAA